MFSRVEKVQTIHVQQGETERKYNVMYEKGDKQFTYHLFMLLLYYLIFISSCLFIIIYSGRKIIIGLTTCCNSLHCLA